MTNVRNAFFAKENRDQLFNTDLCFSLPFPCALLPNLVYFLIRSTGSIPFCLVGAARFELATSWSRTRRATELRYTPKKNKDLTGLRAPLSKIHLQAGRNPACKWSQCRDSNPGPAHYECAALPTELHWLARISIIADGTGVVTTRKGSKSKYISIPKTGNGRSR